MFKLPSIVKEYSAVYSGDPSLVQAPTRPEGKAATDETIEQFEKALKEHEHRLNVARETGDYSALLIEGAGEPTLFQMRQLTADAFAYLIGQVYPREGNIATNALAFRFALRSVSNLGEAKVKIVEHDKLGPIASLSFFDKAGMPAELAMSIATELGDLVLDKARLRPS